MFSRRAFLVRAGSVWLLLLAIAIINGIIRVAVWEPLLGTAKAHWVSTLLLCAIFVFVVWLLVPYLLSFATSSDESASKRQNRSLLGRLGVLWVLLTMAFEFLAGHYLFGHTWESLWADYNIGKGRVWVFVLVTLLFAPVAVGKWRGFIAKQQDDETSYLPH